MRKGNLGCLRHGRDVISSRQEIRKTMQSSWVAGGFCYNLLEAGSKRNHAGGFWVAGVARTSWRFLL
jgi:hypothetical protein